MRKRQIKKIIGTYYWDTEEDIMLPPSVMREEFRAEEVYYSKAFIISNPEKAEEAGYGQGFRCFQKTGNLCGRKT